MADDNRERKSSFLWRRPRRKWWLGIPIGALFAFGFGAIALGTTNYVLHKTGETDFCYTCHSHEAFIKPEYEASSHFSNPSGVRAGCSDCHLPHDNWFDLVATKIVVSFDIIPELQGKLETKEKYEAHRAEMAQEVWHTYIENDSQFCKSCHSFDAMNFDAQDRRVARTHQRAVEDGETCVQCHYGIVHEEPENATELMEQILAEYADGGAAGN